MDILLTASSPLFSLLGMHVSLADLLGFVSGILCVWLTARGNVWNFPVGILNSAILGLVFLQQRLYADTVLQLVFIALAILGWHNWIRGQIAHEDSQVFLRGQRAQIQLSACCAVAAAAIWMMVTWANGSAPLLDALITALSLGAQWQLNRRELQTWIWWIAVDLISIPLYWSRGLPLIALLYGVFLVLCLRGWQRWSRQLSATTTLSGSTA